MYKLSGKHWTGLRADVEQGNLQRRVKGWKGLGGVTYAGFQKHRKNLSQSGLSAASADGSMTEKCGHRSQNTAASGGTSGCVPGVIGGSN